MPKKERIQELFDDIAPDYDRLNHIMSFDVDKGWRCKAVKTLLKGGDEVRKVLDVAGGTGDFSVAIAKKAPADCSICCFDLSEGMLAVGREKFRKLGMDNKIETMQGDCEQLPFADGSFDRVSVAFGIRNFEHLEKGISEMCRVLKKGGKLVILELSYPDNRFLNACFRFYSLKFMPFVGGKISGNKGAYSYLPASILAFPKKDVILPMLGRCGFSRAVHKAFTFGVCRMYIAEK